MSTVQELEAAVEGCWGDVRRELEGLELDTLVFPDPPWTARDLLIHCAFWNDEAVRSLEAFRRGESYMTDTGASDFDAGVDALNNRIVAERRVATDAEARDIWIAAQDRLTAAVRDLDDGDLGEETTAPWHERVTIEAMVRDELGHETGHVDDIITAVSAQETGR